MDRALIVDNDKLIHYAISRVLQPYYSEIKTVSNGDEAIHELSHSFYHLCFLEFALPGANGADLMRTVLRLSPKTKVVVMADAPFDDNSKKEVEDACFCCLMKPFEVTELKAIALQALGRMEEEPDQEPLQRAGTPLSSVVDYSITVLDLGKPTKLNLKGDVLEIGHSGVRMRTNYPLEAGHLVVFTSGLDSTHHKTGIVRNSDAEDSSKSYHVNIDFIDS